MMSSGSNETLQTQVVRVGRLNISQTLPSF